MASRPEIRLDSGIEIRLDCLFQYRTYGGLLEGRPTRKLNAELIHRALEYPAEKLWMGGTPHLLAPPEGPWASRRMNGSAGTTQTSRRPSRRSPAWARSSRWRRHGMRTQTARRSG